MFCKKCGTENDDGNFCPECGTRVITNKVKLSRILFAFTVIGFSLLIGFFGDNQFFGYSLITLYIIAITLLMIITVTWLIAKKNPQISINTIKQDFTNLTTNLKGINELPDNYKNLILLGYLSIILLFISLFLNVISNHLFGDLNENEVAGWLTVITLLLGFVFYFYYFIRISLKLRKISNKNSIRNHYNIILGLIAIFAFFKVILSQFNII